MSLGAHPLVTTKFWENFETSNAENILKHMYYKPENIYFHHAVIKYKYDENKWKRGSRNK